MRALPTLTLLGLALACRGEYAGLSNEMVEASTPYLARARRQPVGWQGWSRETFKLAGRLDRPILLAVGAGACRPCALMDRETYDDPALAMLIDSLFIPLRVDADERPDLAQRYETAVNLLTGLQGYPLTVFLTPEGSAFFGGTYFPPDDPLTGRGLRQILPEVAKSFHVQHAFVLRQAALLHQLAYTRAEGARGVLGPDLVTRGVGSVRAALALALRERMNVGTVAAAEGVLLLFEAAHTGSSPGDSSDLEIARAVLDVDVDSVAVLDAQDLPSLERAAALEALTLGWQHTGDPRYRDAARLSLAILAQQTATPGRVVFTDREAFVAGVLLEAGSALGDTAGTRVARQALDGVVGQAYVRTQGARHVLRQRGTPALLEDQVQLAGACVAAFRVTGDPRYREVAEDLTAIVERDFADPIGGYFDAGGADPVAPAFGERTKQVLDGALPGANATAAQVLLALATVTHEPSYRQRAEAALEAFAGLIPTAGLRAATYLRAAEAVLPAR
jgi:uncharacterized protein YyaL (SSP411 family)